MRDYIIATDADSELLLSYVLEKGLPVFPMPLTLDDVEYNYDLGLTVQIPDFFEKIANGASFSSSCKSPWELKQWFEGLLKTSKNILYIGLSNQLSKHFENCVMAARELMEEDSEANILLVDTLSISAGQALLVKKAVELREAGKPMEEVAQWLEEHKQNSVVFFSVDDLNYLKRGGRLSGGAAFFGTVLDIKPILHTTEDGKLVPIEKVKGKKKAWRRMAELVAERILDKDDEIIVQYTDKQAGEWMCQLLHESCGAENILLMPVGPVIGGHTGPGVMGLSFMGKER